MRCCGFCKFFCAVFRFPDPLYAPLYKVYYVPFNFGYIGEILGIFSLFLGYITIPLPPGRPCFLLGLLARNACCLKRPAHDKQMLANSCSLQVPNKISFVFPCFLKVFSGYFGVPCSLKYQKLPFFFPFVPLFPIIFY